MKDLPEPLASELADFGMPARKPSRPLDLTPSLRRSGKILRSASVTVFGSALLFVFIAFLAGVPVVIDWLVDHLG